MDRFSLENKPEVTAHRKTGFTYLAFCTEPFVVETQEGDMTISPETVDDWDGGYFLAYPADGSKPYSIAPEFVRENYEPVKVVKSKGCWKWQGSGTFRVSSDRNAGRRTPKRMAYVLVKGSIPAGTPLISTCKNPNCVNPDHQRPQNKRSRKRRCAHCGQSRVKGFSQINRSESGRVFCGRSCATSYNNRGKQRFGPKDWSEVATRGGTKRKWLSEGHALICKKCGFNGTEKPWCIEIDHINPVHLGGKTLPENLQPLCLNCHKDKTVQEHKARARKKANGV